MQINAKDRPSQQNIRPGLVIDSQLTHPAYKQFYLNSHTTFQVCLHWVRHRKKVVACEIVSGRESFSYQTKLSHFPETMQQQLLMQITAAIIPFIDSYTGHCIHFVLHGPRRRLQNAHGRHHRPHTHALLCSSGWLLFSKVEKLFSSWKMKEFLYDQSIFLFYILV